MNESLGLLEVKGLLGAITMADVMVKASNVHVVNIDRANGFGWFTVKVVGDVGAIQSAIQAGSITAKEMGCFIGCKVIPRVSQSVVDVFLKEEDAQENAEFKNNEAITVDIEVETDTTSQMDIESSTIEELIESGDIEATLDFIDTAVDESKNDMSLVEEMETIADTQHPKKSTKTSKSKKKSTSKK